MTLETLKDTLSDYAKDIKLNIGTVLTADGAPDLTERQIFGVALASAYATKNPTVTEVILKESSTLSDAEKAATKAAVTIMAMNNIYYRFVHLVGGEYSKLPAKLRMNVIGQPGIPKVDFELYSLAVSSINGCGMCMEAHVHEISKAGVSSLGIQSAIRIAAVVNALSQAEFITTHSTDTQHVAAA